MLPRAVLLLLACAAATAGEPLFESTEMLQLELRYRFDAICMNPVEQDCDDVYGVISYDRSAEERVEIDVRIRTRGRWSRRTARCDLPSLFVYFDEQQTAGTLFEGQSMLPLTTHCRHRIAQYRDHVQVEYLAHRIYNLLTEFSLRTRLLRVRHTDTGSRRYLTREAFFVEHFDKLAARTESRWLDIDGLDLDDVRPEQMARLSVFQYMIGNLDWSSIRLHNVAAFEDEDGRLVPVPYDFDYSGFVSTPYASPPSELPVNRITTRYYRGLCWPGLDWAALFAEFSAVRADVGEELEALKKLSIRERRRVRGYLKDFYRTIESGEKRHKLIVDACRPLPDSLSGG